MNPSNPQIQRNATPASSSTYQSRSATPNNVPNAAFLAATRAFSKSPVKQTEPVGSDYGRRNGALSAATSVHSGYPSRSSSTASRPHINTNSGEYWTRSELADALVRSQSTVSKSNDSSRSSINISQSASFRAANIAAANHIRNTPKNHPYNPPIVVTPPEIGIDGGIRKPASRRSKSWAVDDMDNNSSKREEIQDTTREQRLDATSIPATTSLVKMFEQQSSPVVASTGGTKPAVGRKPSLAKGTPPPIVAPKPQRTIPIHSVSPELQRPSPLPKPKPKPKTGVTPTDTGSTKPTTNSDIVMQQKPNLPPPRRAAKIITPGISTDPEKANQPSLKAPSPNTAQPKRYASQSPGFQTRNDLSSNSNRPSPVPYQDRALRGMSPHITGDSLANAIVGANLALKHNSPPKRSKTPPPLPTPRRKAHHGHHFSLRSHSLSPPKTGALKQTLRAQPDEEEKEKNLKRHRFRQPNKHREGSRSRWQDEITEAERKRYEGVWAANKGVLMPSNSSPEAFEEVLNLVVRDIWSRSRLPPQKLEMIWTLVVDASDDKADTGRLNREQFVVGMWLIDQGLRGRTLPNSVSPSIWASVRLRGVKVRLEGRGRDGRKF
jgi:hypothetical protein